MMKVIFLMWKECLSTGAGPLLWFLVRIFIEVVWRLMTTSKFEFDIIAKSLERE